MHRNQNVFPSDRFRLGKAYESLPRNEINHGLVDGRHTQKANGRRTGRGRKRLFRGAQNTVQVFEPGDVRSSGLAVLLAATRR